MHRVGKLTAWKPGRICECGEQENAHTGFGVQRALNCQKFRPAKKRRMTQTAKDREGYGSKTEGGMGWKLKKALAASEIQDYDEHRTLDLVVNGHIVGTLIVDFIVYHLDGTTEYIDTKNGWHDPTFKIKWNVLVAMNDGGDDKFTILEGNRWRR